MVVIPTVQHTGTIWLAKHLFGGNGFEVCTFRGEARTDKVVHYGHCWPGELKYMRPLLKRYPAVVPLRHPHLVFEAWRRRHRTHFEMLLQWSILINEVDKYKPLYLPIDRPDRDKYLRAINRRLGVELNPDWSPQHSFTGTHSVDPLSVDVYDDCRAFFDQPFFRRFYDTRRRGTGEAPPANGR